MIAKKISDLRLDPYKPLQEISIQEEFIDFIKGDDFGESKYVPFIIKSLKRDKYSVPKKCICWDDKANEGLCDCPYCDGIGYYWKEYVIPGIIFLLNKRKLVGSLDSEIKAGRKEDYELAFLTPYQIKIEQKDILIEPNMNNGGYIKIPFKPKSKFLVLETLERRLDYGKNEYRLSIISKIF